MKQTVIMLAGLAAVFAASVACSKLFSSSPPPADAPSASSASRTSRESRC